VAMILGACSNDVMRSRLSPVSVAMLIMVSLTCKVDGSSSSSSGSSRSLKYEIAGRCWTGVCNCLRLLADHLPSLA
jgi:hypothetical protein